MTRLPLGGAIAAIIALMIMLAGCSGGGDDGGSVTPPPGDTGTIQGRVVRADDPSLGLADASVQLRSATGVVLGEALADNTGAFSFTDVPVGSQTLVVDTLGEAAYGLQTVTGVVVSDDLTTSIMVTVLRVTDPEPSVIFLTPASATIDLKGQIQFTATVQTSSGLLSVVPTFFVTGQIGSVSYDPIARKVVFRGERVGTGTLIAAAGNVKAEADITVTDPAPPQITTFVVAPLSLRATGGTIGITVAATDGDGLATVQAEVFYPDASSQILDIPKVAGTDETYRLELDLPANDNPPDAGGHQATQRYSIRIIVTDNTSSQTISPNFIDVTVAGLDSPPPPI